MDNFKGYSLFNDIKDETLQERNRAVVMCNIYEDNPHLSDKTTTSKKGALLIFGYMDKVPEEKRAALITTFHAQMETRGYQSVA